MPLAAAVTDCRFWVCCYCSSMEHYLAPLPAFPCDFPSNQQTCRLFCRISVLRWHPLVQTVYRVGVGVGVVEWLSVVTTICVWWEFPRVVFRPIVRCGLFAVFCGTAILKWCIRIAMSLCDLRMCCCSGVCVLLCIVYYFSPLCCLTVSGTINPFP